MADGLAIVCSRGSWRGLRALPGRPTKIYPGWMPVGAATGGKIQNRRASLLARKFFEIPVDNYRYVVATVGVCHRGLRMEIYMGAKAQISVPVDPNLKREIEAAARAVKRPVAYWIRDVVAAALANAERQQQQTGGARSA